MKTKSVLLRLVLAGLAVLVFSGQSMAQYAIHPMGGQRGASFEMTISGFKDPSAAVFDCDSIKGELENKKTGGENKAVLKVKIDSTAPPGAHIFRIVSAEGISRPLMLQVSDEPVINEIDGPHNKPTEAQYIGYPATIDGRIARGGESDYYAFEVPANKKLCFELITFSGLIPSGPPLFTDPELSLYDPTGSWLDPHQPSWISDVEDESLLFYYPPRLPTNTYEVYVPRISKKFEKAGWYLVKVNSLDAKGGPEFNYHLRVTVADEGQGTKDKWTPRRIAHNDTTEWEERDFAQKVGSDWIQSLLARTHWEPKSKEGEAEKGVDFTSATLARVSEKEPNEKCEQALDFSTVSILEGVISQPGDVDCFKFKVKDGEALAFEIRTPDEVPPNFSPRVTIKDKDGKEVLSNIYRKIAGGGVNWTKSVESKITYTFAQGGEFYLEARDLTTRNGCDRFKYQIVVRPQIPHVGVVFNARVEDYGRMRVKDLQITLKPGEPKKLSIVAEREEGYEGDIALYLENLPKAVTAYTTSGIVTEGGLSFSNYESHGAVNLERFRPKRQVNNITLVVNADELSTATTAMPHNLRLMAMPIVDGKPGKPFAFQEIPLLIQAKTEQAQTAGQLAKSN